jgi:peptidoglycan/xylan/chitin deacetylase (PgdA/CDA1 family)
MSQKIETPWPESCQGAVSLTFDDGMKSHLELAVPILNDHSLRGTFYINPRGDNWQETLMPWREVAKAGHEVANHTINHPCSRNFSGNPTVKGLESMTLADIESDVLEASRRLRSAIPEQAVFSFCYPCYQDFVGEGINRQSYVPIIAKHFPAARAKGEYANHPLVCDLHYLWSWPVERHSGASLVGLAEQCAAQGRWGILTFHGILQGHLSVAETDFRELCGFLKRNQSRIWTAPVVEVAQRVAEWRKGRMKN